MPGGCRVLTLSVTTPIKVDIWSDVQCPWCYIGKRKFEQGVAESGVPVEVEYHSFELAPDTPVDFEGHAAVDYLSAKFRPTCKADAEQASACRHRPAFRRRHRWPVRRLRCLGLAAASARRDPGWPPSVPPSAARRFRGAVAAGNSCGDCVLAYRVEESSQARSSEHLAARFPRPSPTSRPDRARIRDSDLSGVRIASSQVDDLRITGFDGQAGKVVVDDVEVTDFVKAELDRSTRNGCSSESAATADDYRAMRGTCSSGSGRKRSSGHSSSRKASRHGAGGTTEWSFVETLRPSDLRDRHLGWAG